MPSGHCVLNILYYIIALCYNSVIFSESQKKNGIIFHLLKDNFKRYTEITNNQLKCSDFFFFFQMYDGGDNHLIIVCLKIVTQISRYLTIKSPETMNDFENKETAENLKQLLPSALVASKHVSTTQ